MAEVFAAEDLRLGRAVAVKMLRAHLAADEQVRERFELEARTAARLLHPNVVGIFDTAEDDGVAYIVMERLPGTTLADELRTGPMSEERAREVARQVLAALAAAHAVGIVHRDIKPANVLTCADGQVKVADFGIATAMDEASGITSTGVLVGTPAYLAPERLDGSPATASADLYSLGALLYVALAGRQPFESRNTLGLIAAIREEEPVPLAELRPDLDPALASLVSQAMAKDPADRPASAAAMAALLEAGIGDTAELPADPAPTRVMARPGAGDTQVLERPGPATPAARPRLGSLGSLGRWEGWGRARRYRVQLAFLTAALLALAIALSLSAGGGGAPSAPPARRSAPPPSYPVVRHVPASFTRALDGLERAVG